ncbi:Haloacid dehalogenase-like hydrolase-domain-containing protein [Vararia minispora EC-137]|uniref:Haloacid dehalogenase-like hydrolase-domain-containing protein n=1 Tax=Vararia minispora EC-137 TaxID=1314806 RepID=A0ACB8QDT6_9AGAM|nr:Haloacid dehalogenase-like hydrolase-domain-containing protein [Vararia minispora EC-137]
MTLSTLCSTLIMDIGDVLFTWSPVTTTSIKPRQLKAILNSPTWHTYECGRLDEEECYKRVGVNFSLDPAEIRQAFQDARDSMKADNHLISFLRELKAQSGGQLRIFAMSNISAPDYEILKTKDADWSIFEHIFTSAAAGARKPSRSFYRHVLAKSGTDPATTVFVDDKPENVLAARAVGLNAIVFDDLARVQRALRNYVGNPAARARVYLNERAGKHNSVTDTGITVDDNFCQLLIFEATRDPSLVNYQEPLHKWNYFKNPVQSEGIFPCDLDTTSIGMTVTNPQSDALEHVLNEMLQYRDEEDIVMTYFDWERPRTDPVVCVNVLTLFYSQGRGADLVQTLDYVHDVLLHRAYQDGTRYYVLAESFLFFTARLLQSTTDPDLHARLGPLLVERLQERVGASGDALALAMRVLACAVVGIRDVVDARVLRMMQEEDGGWPVGWFCRNGKTGIKIGNRGYTTALAMNALIMAEGPLPLPASLPPAYATPNLRISTAAALSLNLSPTYSSPPSPEPTNSPILISRPKSPFSRRLGHRRLSSVSEIAKSMLTTILAWEGSRSRKGKLDTMEGDNLMCASP